MLEWWMELPAWLRMTLGVVLMVVGGLILWAQIASDAGNRRAYTWPIAMCGLGFAMVMVGGKTDSEKNNYRF